MPCITPRSDSRKERLRFSSLTGPYYVVRSVLQCTWMSQVEDVVVVAVLAIVLVRLLLLGGDGTLVVVVLVVSGAVYWTRASFANSDGLCELCGAQAEINASLHALKAPGFVNSPAWFVENMWRIISDVSDFENFDSFSHGSCHPKECIRYFTSQGSVPSHIFRASSLTKCSGS